MEIEMQVKRNGIRGHLVYLVSHLHHVTHRTVRRMQRGEMASPHKVISIIQLPGREPQKLWCIFRVVVTLFSAQWSNSLPVPCKALVLALKCIMDALAQWPWKILSFSRRPATSCWVKDLQGYIWMWCEWLLWNTEVQRYDATQWVGLLGVYQKSNTLHYTGKCR